MLFVITPRLLLSRSLLSMHALCVSSWIRVPKLDTLLETHNAGMRCKRPAFAHDGRSACRWIYSPLWMKRR